MILDQCEIMAIIEMAIVIAIVIWMDRDVVTIERSGEVENAEVVVVVVVATVGGAEMAVVVSTTTSNVTKVDLKFNFKYRIYGTL